MPCQLTYSGYNLTQWNIEEEVQFQVAKCGNSIPIFRYAEVLLNYAEAMAELGKMTDAVWAESVGLIRQRAGLTYGSKLRFAFPEKVTHLFDPKSEESLLF